MINFVQGAERTRYKGADGIFYRRGDTIGPLIQHGFVGGERAILGKGAINAWTRGIESRVPVFRKALQHFI